MRFLGEEVMKNIFLLGSLLVVMSHVVMHAMEEQQQPQKRKIAEVEEVEKEKETEKEYPLTQQPPPKRRRRISPTKPVGMKSLKEISKQTFIENIPNLENFPEAFESIPAEQLKEEMRIAAQQRLPFEETKLHNAQDEQTVDNLLALGVDPNIKDRDGRTALNALIDKGFLDAAFRLATIKGKNLDVHTPDERGITPLARAIKREDIELAELIIEILQAQDRISSIYNPYSPIFVLAIRYMPALIPQLAHLDPSRTNKLDEGMDDRTPLMIAAQYNADSIKPLIDARANPHTTNKNGNTALHFAAQYNSSAIKPLIDAGAKPNERNKNGFTPLMLAVQHNSEAIQPLIAAHADPDATDNRGWTPLMGAILSHPKSIEPLIAGGANLNARDNRGWTPLMLAVINYPKAIKPILDAGANPNFQTDSGQTALSQAIDNDNLEAVRLLLEAGAIVTQKAVELANNNFEMQKLLAEHFEKLFTQQ